MFQRWVPMQRAASAYVPKCTFFKFQDFSKLLLPSWFTYLLRLLNSGVVIYIFSTGDLNYFLEFPSLLFFFISWYFPSTQLFSHSVLFNLIFLLRYLHCISFFFFHIYLLIHYCKSPLLYTYLCFYQYFLYLSMTYFLQPSFIKFYKPFDIVTL